jgi:hypothetical protein
MVEILANQLEGSLLLPEPAILVMMPAESSPPMPLSRFQQSLSFSAALGLSLMSTDIDNCTTSDTEK